MRRALYRVLPLISDTPIIKLARCGAGGSQLLLLANLRSYQKSDVEALQALFAEDANRLWQEIVSPSQPGKGELPMPHDGYLHLYAKSNPRLPGDFIILDESQDASEVIKHIVLSQDAQPIIVGDQRQSIFGWRGARS